MKKKEIEEYLRKYGDVPKDFFERFSYIIKELNMPLKEVERLQKSIKKLMRAKWGKFNFVIYFLPKATPRARLGNRKIFYVKDANSNSVAFKEFIESLGTEIDIITTPCRLFVDLYLPIPSQMSRLEKLLAELKLIYPVSKPDWDNAGKTYSDMIQKHLLLEDSLVIDGRVRKFFSFKPRIEVKIEYMLQYDCKFNKKRIESWKFYKDLEENIIEKDSII